MASALHPQTLLATRYASEELADPYGYPLRLRTAVKLGFKNPKWITAIEVTNTYPGGYWESRGFNWFSGYERPHCERPRRLSRAWCCPSQRKPRRRVFATPDHRPCPQWPPPRWRRGRARFPQPVRVGDLAGRLLLQPEESQPVLGRVTGLVRRGDGAVGSSCASTGRGAWLARPAADRWSGIGPGSWRCRPRRWRCSASTSP